MPQMWTSHQDLCVFRVDGCRYEHWSLVLGLPTTRFRACVLPLCGDDEERREEEEPAVVAYRLHQS